MSSLPPPQQQQSQSQPQPHHPQHQQQQQQQQPSPSQVQRTEEARAAFTASLHSVGANLDADLRARAANLHENAAALAKQEADLQRATAKLSQQNDQWTKIADQARQGLKEIGDVQNWAELIERDLLIVEETLRLAEDGDKDNDDDNTDTDMDMDMNTDHANSNHHDGGDGHRHSNNKADDQPEERDRVLVLDGIDHGGSEGENNTDSAKKQTGRESLWRRWW